MRRFIVLAALFVSTGAGAVTDQEKLGKLLAKTTVEDAFDVQHAKVACVCKDADADKDRVGILTRSFVTDKWRVQCGVISFSAGGVANIVGACLDWELLTK